MVEWSSGPMVDDDDDYDDYADDDDDPRQSICLFM